MQNKEEIQFRRLHSCVVTFREKTFSEKCTHNIVYILNAGFRLYKGLRVRSSEKSYLSNLVKCYSDGNSI